MQQLITREKLPNILRSYMLMTIGTICLALALNIFLVPNQIVFGGLTGIATIINSLVNLPIGTTALILNIPLFLIGLHRLGGLVFGLRTVFATVLLSLFIDAFAGKVDRFVQHDPLIYTFYGGLLSGIGTGLVLRAGGTTGGTDIIAKLLQRWRGIRPGQGLLALSVLIFAAAGYVYGTKPVLYALLVAFIESQVVNVILDGFQYGRKAIIVSQHPEAIRDAVLRELDRGVTLLEGRGGYTDAERTVLLCVVTQSEIVALKTIIHEADPQAFVVISATAEVLGEGFRPVLGKQ